MRKRGLCLILAVLTILLSACGAPPPAATASPSPTPEPEPTPTPVPEARELTAGLTVTGRGEEWPKLTDGERETKYYFGMGTALTVSSPEDIYALYMIWDQPTSGYEIAIGDEVIAAGAEGFLHEYIVLPAPASELTVTLTGSNGTLCDVRAFSEGTVPDGVQLWQPPCDSADILFLPTHSDDDPIFFGAAIAYYGGELGLDVQIAYMCMHWEDPPRPHELLDGLWTMGIENYPVMGRFVDRFSDNIWGAMGIVPAEDVIGWQVEMIRRFRPSVVVDHDQEGEYGHGAHRLNAYGILRAFDMASDETQYPASADQYGVWYPSKLYLHLEQEGQLNKVVLDVNTPLDAFAGKTAFEVSQMAMECHESQLQYSHRPRQGQDNEYPEYDCTLYALMESLVGPDDNCNDLMEHIGA